MLIKLSCKLIVILKIDCIGSQQKTAPYYPNHAQILARNKKNIWKRVRKGPPEQQEIIPVDLNNAMVNGNADNHILQGRQNIANITPVVFRFHSSFQNEGWAEFG